MKETGSSTIPLTLLAAGVLKKLLIVERNLVGRKAMSSMYLA